MSSQEIVMSTENKCTINLTKFDGIAEPNTYTNIPIHPFWGSVRMTYTICAFFAMFVQLCMRNALNYVILHMVKQNDTSDMYPTSPIAEDNEFMNTNFSEAKENLDMQGELSWTRTDVLHLQSSYYYGYVLTLSIAGRLADKYGGKIFFVQSIATQSLIFMIMPFCARSSYILTVIMQILQGLIAGFSNPALYQLFTVWSHPSERTATLSFAFGGYSLGSLIIFPLASFLCTFSWDMVFFTIGSVSLVFGIIFQKLVYSTLLEHPRLTKAEYEYLNTSKKSKQNLDLKIPWRDICTSYAIYAFVLTHIFHSYGLIVFSLMIPRYLRETMDISLDKVGLYSTAPFLGTFLSQGITVLFSGLIEKRITLDLCKFRRILYALCCLTTVILIVGVIYCEKNHEIFLLLLLFGIGLTSGIGFAAAYWPSLLFMAPSYAGLLSGISTSLATCSGFLAPIAIKKIVVQGTKLEWDRVMISLAVFYSLSAIIYGTFGRSKRQYWDHSIPTCEKTSL